MKKSLVVIILIMTLAGITTGFLIGAVSRLALIDIFLSLAPTNAAFPENNVLVLGIDGTQGQLSDTIILLHLDPEKKEATAVSIPRDTLAILPGRGLNKVNAAYAFGGAELSRRTVEGLLGVSIPYYVTVNLNGVEGLINEVGGVTVNVEKRMFYQDYAGDLHIDLKPGLQRLSGKDAIGYLRYRHDDSDFARIARQQKFIRALAAEFMKKDNILKSPRLFLSTLSLVDTNLNSREILGLSLGLRGAYELGQVYMLTVPGTDLMVDGIYYWKADDTALQKIVRRYFSANKMAAYN